jgi:hypothetical protein
MFTQLLAAAPMILATSKRFATNATKARRTGFREGAA